MAFARRSSSLGGALSIVRYWFSHQSFATRQDSSLVSGTPSLRQLTAYHLPLYFFVQRRPLGTHVISRLTGIDRAFRILTKCRTRDHPCKRLICQTICQNPVRLSAFVKKRLIEQEEP
jgi:hypothetical protein